MNLPDAFAKSRPLMRRLELAEALQNARFIEELRRTRPASGAEVRQVGSGFALFAGPGTPMSQALGLGLDGPVDAAQIDAVEELLSRGGGAVVVSVLPCADPSLSTLLAERRYRAGEFHHVLLKLLGEDDLGFTAPAGLTVRPIDAGEKELWARTVLAGFLEKEEANVAEAPWFTPTVPEGTTCFIAFDGARAVGAGSVSVEGDVAIFSGTSVLPSARGKGLQLALIRARLAHAKQAGCAMGNSATLPATGSQRNLERAGFRIHHCRVMMVRDPPASSAST